MSLETERFHLAVVIPCYRVSRQIESVLARIGPGVRTVICVDDACPERTGEILNASARDPRVRVLVHPKNRGVGGAMVTGYREALALGAEVVVKIDGDGQMDPTLIRTFVRPILEGRADYTKGNRFYDLKALKRMPRIRLIGNALLSFLTKASSGYWEVFDPTNGYTAIHAKTLRELPLETIDPRYFFESDMLFRLNTMKAAVVDIPMIAVYADEASSLRIRRVVIEFLARHAVNVTKRIFYNYFLRDFSVASVQLLLGTAMLAFGILFGLIKWRFYGYHGIPAPTGTVMVAVMPTLIGIQLVLGFLAFDMRPGPQEAVHLRLPD